MIATARLEAWLYERNVPFTWIGNPPEGFVALRVDSRDVGPGDLFVAITGTGADGHDYVPSAVRAGATAVVVERPVETDVPVLRVDDTRLMLAHLALATRGDPGKRLSLVGVTGTNGKTTTSLILRHVLGGLGPAAGLGTLGLWLPDGARCERGRITTPGPLALAADLEQALDAGAKWLVMEVSSHALDQKRVNGLVYDAAIFTNLSHEHLDYHPDMDAYRSAKLALLELLRSDGVAIVNLDEPAWRGADFLERRVVTFGLSADADVRASHIVASAMGSRWQLHTPSGRTPVTLPLLGDFNVHNALAAAAAGWALGLDPGSIASRLASTPQVPGRMERLAGPPGPLVLRDYAHTPDGLALALAALRPFAERRLTVVFGCGGDRDRTKRPLMGQVAVTGADRVVLTTDNPRTESLDQILADIVGGQPGSFEVIRDRADAIEDAVTSAGPGDVVLLAGKGHETYQDVEGEKLPFDEAEIVARLGGRS